MRKLIFSICAVLLLLTSCGTEQTTDSTDNTIHITATTYPVYLFVKDIVQDVPAAEVSLMVNQPVSCLHNYTVSVKDMKLLDRSDLIFLNGAGLEENMSDALNEVSDTPQIDCSEGIPLLTLEEDGELESDPHIWMDPSNACIMIENIANAMASYDSAHAASYRQAAQDAVDTIESEYESMTALLEPLNCRELITFHDGFQYFADAFDLTILCSVEEESGSEASAREVREIVSLIRSHKLPAIFTECNGSNAAAGIIEREVGICAFPLTLMMSQDPAMERSSGVGTYLNLLQMNLSTVLSAYT